jgi:hypothetical protein
MGEQANPPRIDSMPSRSRHHHLASRHEQLTTLIDELSANLLPVRHLAGGSILMPNRLRIWRWASASRAIVLARPPFLHCGFQFRASEWLADEVAHAGIGAAQPLFRRRIRR